MPLSEEHAALIPEEIRSDPSLQSFNDVGGIAKGFIETKALVGRSIQLPNGESKPEDMDKWAGEQSAKLKDRGYHISKYDPAPEKPDGYKFSVEGKSDQEINAAPGVKLWREIAHKNGLSNATANKILNEYGLKLESIAPKPPEFIEGDGLKPLMEKEFQGHSLSVVDQEFKAALKQLAADIPALPDVLEEGVIEVERGKFVALKYHPAIIRLVRDVGVLKASDFGGNIAGLTASDSLESVDAEIETLRKQANESNNQFDREKIGEKMNALYRKKQALQMRKAS